MVVKKNLSINSSVAPGEVRWAVEGVLSETVELPSVDGSQVLRIDLKGLTHVNSRGLMAWSSWLANRQPPNGPQIVLENCPYVFVRHFSLMKRVIWPNVSVQSFFVPFYSEASGEEKMVLFRRGQEFTEAGAINPPTVRDASGSKMEMDVSDTYFRFLKS